MVRMYEEKMTLKSDPSTIAWHFYIHDDRSIEFIKTPTIITQVDIEMIRGVTMVMMDNMGRSNIADMKCIYVGV